MSPTRTDPIRWQINVQIEAPRGWQVTPGLIREALRYRLDEDEDPPGFRFQIIEWTTRRGTDSGDRHDEDRTWQKFTHVIRAALDKNAALPIMHRAAVRGR